MDIRVKATNYEMTPEIENYLNERINTLPKFLGSNADLTRCEVEIGRDAGRPRHGANIWFAEIRLVIPGEDAVYARNNSESVNGAIDDVKQEIERQLRKVKRREIQGSRRVGAKIKEWLWWGQSSS